MLGHDGRVRPRPLIAPTRPLPAGMRADLARIEARAFEYAATERPFGGGGASLAVANATLGLTLALADAVGPAGRGRMALITALTFAATAQAHGGRA